MSSPDPEDILIDTVTRLLREIWSNLRLGVMEGSDFDELNGVAYLPAEVSSRSGFITLRLNEVNDFVLNTDSRGSTRLLFLLLKWIPRTLLAYQALRFPQILESDAALMPRREDLGSIPAIVEKTGVFLPVSACLRLIAVCMVDDAARQFLVESGGVKTVVSHLVDDPLNPFQRESAIFAVKMLTLNFPPAQAEVDRIMHSGRGDP